jgi:cation:H+ antiporter
VVLGFSGLVANLLIGAISILVLVLGAELVVSKMGAVAKHYGISEVVIAVTVVSVGTSLPELALHVVGSLNILASSGMPLEMFSQGFHSLLLDSHAEVLQSLVSSGKASAEVLASSSGVYMQKSGAVFGASIGSDVVQETLVMGLVIFSSALIAEKKGFRFSRKFLIRDYAPMMVTTLITLILALNWKGVVSFLSGGALKVSGTLTRLDGLVLVGSFCLYIYYLYTTRSEELAEQGDVAPSERPRLDFVIGVAGMMVVIGSAEVFLRIVEVGVQYTGLSSSMIGVATVGVVSAMPEMVTAISGLRHGSEGVSLGTLVGSNITNPLLAIGSGAVISTYAVPRPLVLWDLPMETVLAGVPVIYMFSRSSIGNYLAKPFRKAGFKQTAEKLEEADNRVLSIAGATILIFSYFFYLYIRFKYFGTDFG